MGVRVIERSMYVVKVEDRPELTRVFASLQRAESYLRRLLQQGILKPEEVEECTG